MNRVSFYLRVILTAFVFLSGAFNPLGFTKEPEAHAPVSKAIDRIAERLSKGEALDQVFSIPISKTPLGEVRVQWLDPAKLIEGSNPKEAARYIGSVGFVRFKADFFRVSHTISAYSDESKFLPGVVSTKVISRVKSGSKEIVRLMREREMPLALRAMMMKTSSYHATNEIKMKEGEWTLIRIKLSSDEKQSKLLRALEAVEYVKKMKNGELWYVTMGFALPNTGFLNLQKSQESKKSALPMGKVFEKVASKLDVRNQLFDVMTKSILDGVYQNLTSVTQVTTDPRWNNKWARDLTTAETEQLLKENKASLEKAKKNDWIKYPPAS